MISYLTIIAVTMAAFFTAATSTQANQAFSDVSESHGAHKEIQYLVEKGVIKGYTAENGLAEFRPNKAVTRAQVAKMLVLGSGETPSSATVSSFSDIKANDDYIPYIEKAVELGYFEVEKGQAFYPNEYIKRGEMSYALVKAFKLDTDEYKGLPTIFGDVSANHRYAKEINAVYYNGLAIRAMNFNPDKSLTRAQFSSFVARASSETFRLELPVKGETNLEEKPNPADVIGVVRSTTNGLNVRKGSTTSSAVMGKVNTGGQLAVYDMQGDWLKITYNGEFGYVSKQYVKFVDAQTREFLENATKKVKATQGLNLYYGPSSSSKKIVQVGVIPAGTELDVYSSKDGYYQVMYKDVPGYIVANSATDITPTLPPTTAPSGPTATVGRVTVDYVNVRAQANNQSKQLGQLRIGQRVAVNQISGYWANINFNGQSAWVYKSYLKLLNQNGLPLQNRIIVIDPGHGGKDPGAVSNGYNEKSIVLKVGNLVGQKLRAAGADVRQTRTTDKFLELQEIVDFTNRNEAEIFVSIHVNSFGSSTAHGTETYYSITAGDMYKEDQDLATFINSQIVKNANMYNRGVKTAPYYVTRNVIIPAVLVELGFISNGTDRAKLVSDKYVEIYAESIYQGIVQYYSKQ